MSLQSDLKGYADSAVEAAEAVLGRLQQNLAAAKGTDLEALRSTLEDFVASALVYTSKLSGRAESAMADLKSDPRLAQVIQTGEALATAVVSAVQERVGQAASSAASSAAGASAFVRSQAPGGGRAKPAKEPTVRPTESVFKAAPAKKAAAKKAAAKKAPAKKATTVKTTTVKAAATSAPAKAPAKAAKKVPAKATKAPAAKKAPAKAAKKAAPAAAAETPRTDHVG
jgi:hypothetical protein